MSTKVYVVHPKTSGNVPRLVEGKSKAAVADFILRDFDISLANTAEAVGLAKSGVVLESASEPEAPAAETPA